MKDLIKSQDEELTRIIKFQEESVEEDECGNYKDNVVLDDEELKTFIAKIRKETAEKVCDRMIGEISDLRKAEYSDREEEMWDYGYDTRIKEEKEVKQQILKELL